MTKQYLMNYWICQTCGKKLEKTSSVYNDVEGHLKNCS